MDSKVEINTYSSEILTEQCQREKEYDQDMAHMITQIDLLAINLLLGKVEKVKIMGSHNRGARCDLRRRKII